MTSFRFCPYCSTLNALEHPACQACGGPLTAQPAQETRKRSEPFAYNGYIVWELYDYARRVSEFHFYLGTEPQGVVYLTEDMFREMVPEGCKYMPLVWEMFLVGRGEQEVATWQVEEFMYTVVKSKQEPSRWDGLFTKIEFTGSEHLRITS